MALSTKSPSPEKRGVWGRLFGRRAPEAGTDKQDEAPSPANTLHEIAPTDLTPDPAPLHPDLEPDPATQITEADNFDDLIAQFQNATDALKDLGIDAQAENRPENAVDLPLHVILGLLPEQFIVASELDNVRLRDVTGIVIDDLYDQLAAGYVTTTIARLVENLPARVVIQDAYDDTTTSIVLPLSDVVQSVGLDALRERTAQRYTPYRIASLPDPFPDTIALTEEPLPDVDREDATQPPAIRAPTAAPSPLVPAEPVPIETVPDETVPDEPVPDETVPDEPVPAPETIAPVTATAQLTTTAIGVNLNTAAPEQIMTIDGVNTRTAHAIVYYRQERGLFDSIFELMDIEEVDRAMFRTLTGMPWNRARRDRRSTLSTYLGISKDAVEDLDAVADAVGQHPGIQGCLISTPAGRALARHGFDQDPAALAGALPGLIENIQEGMRTVTAADLQTASLSLDGRTYTIATGARVTVTILHDAGTGSDTRRKCARRVARELDWVLSHRGLIRPPT